MFLVPSFWSSSNNTDFPRTTAVVLWPGEQLSGSLGNTLCPREHAENQHTLLPRAGGGRQPGRPGGYFK